MERHLFLSRLGGYRNFAQHHVYKDLPRHNTNVEHGMVAVGEISDDKEVFVLVRQALSLSSTLKISENLYHSTCASAKYLHIKSIGHICHNRDNRQRCTFFELVYF